MCFCVCCNILFLNINWAFVDIAIGRQICTVNQLNKQFNSSHIIAAGLSLQGSMPDAVNCQKIQKAALVILKNYKKR